MKRLFKVLLIALVLIPFTARADMISPYIKPFEAIVTKKGGITVKNYAGKTKHYDENSVVLITSIGNRIEIYNGVDDYFEVSESDTKYIIPKSSEVKPGSEGVEKLEKQREFEVIVSELKVYNGPSIIFKENGTIKKGTQITAFYEFNTEEARSEWFYIQEENVSGWINIGSNSDEYTVYEVNAKPLKLIFKNSISVNGTKVNANSIYKINYWANPYLGTNPVVKINNENVAFENFDNIEIISENKKKQEIFHMEQYNFTINKDIKLYKEANLKEEITVIPKGTKLSTINLVYAYGMQDYDNYTLYVNYNNKMGWIKVKNVQSKEITISEDEYGIDELVSPYTDPEGDEDPEEETTTVVEETVNNKKNKKNNTKETVIISVIVAISIAITAIATIFVINKKNKKDTLKDINEELEKTQKINVVKKEK